MQKQERGLNNCPVSTAYMTDVILNQNVRGAVYVDGQEQRNWFRDCLLNAAAAPCPRQDQRRSRFKLTEPTFTEFSCTERVYKNVFNTWVLERSTSTGEEGVSQNSTTFYKIGWRSVQNFHVDWMFWFSVF